MKRYQILPIIWNKTENSVKIIVLSFLGHWILHIHLQSTCRRSYTSGLSQYFAQSCVLTSPVCIQMYRPRVFFYHLLAPSPLAYALACE